jgi:crotonobetaine/carnitine-CoA ligase
MSAVSVTDDRPLPPLPPLLRETLTAQAARHGDRALAMFDDRTLGFRDLETGSKRIAAGLQAHGVARGEPVMLVLGNRSEFLTTFFATGWLGAVAAPVNVALKGESLAHLFRLTRPRIAIVEAEFVPRVREALADGPPLERMFVVAGDPPLERMFVVAGDPPRDEPAARAFADLDVNAGRLQPAAIAPGDPCTIMYTSGTTGVAKGVTMPQQQVATCAHDAAEDFRLDKSSVFYTFNPLFHLNGLVFGPLAALAAGCRTVVRSAFPREKTLEDLRRSRATHWCPGPFIGRGLLAAPESPDDADNDLRIAVTFGMNEAEIAAFERRFGCKLGAGYGSTEAGMICRMQTERPTTSGRISNRVEVRFVGEDGEDVAPGEVGEIWMRARQPFNRMLGYWNMPEATAAAFSGEWFKTGDLGRLDADGYLHFADRLKESLKRRGENISTFEVEQALLGFPGVTAAAVVGYRPAPDAEEEVRAFIETADGSVDHRALVEHCARRLAYFMVPRYLEVARDLPRTSLGKIRKQELKGRPLSPSTFDVKAAGIVVER